MSKTIFYWDSNSFQIKDMICRIGASKVLQIKYETSSLDIKKMYINIPVNELTDIKKLVVPNNHT